MKAVGLMGLPDGGAVPAVCCVPASASQTTSVTAVFKGDVYCVCPCGVAYLWRAGHPQGVVFHFVDPESQLRYLDRKNGYQGAIPAWPS